MKIGSVLCDPDTGDRQMSSFAKDSGITFGAQLATFPVAALTSILLARVLGPAGKGTLVLLMMVPTMIALVADLGVGLANAYHVGSGKYRPRLAAGNTLFLSLFLGIVFTGIFYLFMPWLSATALKDVPVKLLRIAALSAPVFVIVEGLNGIFKGKRQFKQFNGIRLSSRVSRLVALAIFFLLLADTVEVGLYAFIAAALLLLALVIGAVKRYVGFDFSIRPSFARDSLSYGIKIHLGSLMDFLNYRLDIFIVNLFWGAAEVGLYTVSVGVAELVFYISLGFSIPLFPRSASSPEDISARFAAVVLRNAIMISAIAAISIGILAPFIIDLAYGDAFAESLSALRVLLIGIVFLSGARVILSHFSGSGKPLRSTAIILTTLVATIVLDFALIPDWGKMGAATASTLAYTLASVLAVAWFRKESRLPLREMLLPTKADFERYLKLMAQLMKRNRISSPERD
jgi:O-antigen/teichoic acid export membrane protein